MRTGIQTSDLNNTRVMPRRNTSRRLMNLDQRQSIAAALRPTDMAFLHYRDAAFLIQRARMRPGETPLWNDTRMTALFSV